MQNVAPKSWQEIRPGMLQGLAPTNGLYSAWNWDKGLYDYYESPDNQRPSYGAEVPLPPVGGALGNALGEDPDVSSNEMPRTAKYVGSGPVALGEIVSVDAGTAGVGPWLGVAAAIVVPTALLYFTVKLGDILGAKGGL